MFLDMITTLYGAVLLQQSNTLPVSVRATPVAHFVIIL